MKTLPDCFGNQVRLTAERLAHRPEHPYVTETPKAGEDLWPIK